MQLKIYEASAGSGKTYRLALEYIALALETGQPSAFANTLAVTFTNKATAEMKDRILAQLYNAAHGGLDAGFMNDLTRRLHLAPEVIAQRARPHCSPSFTTTTVSGWKPSTPFSNLFFPIWPTSWG